MHFSIPFLFNAEDCDTASTYYENSPMVRLPVDRAEPLAKQLAAGMKLWVDPMVDGFGRTKDETSGKSWEKYVRKAPYYECLYDPEFLSKPTQNKVDEFADYLLDACGRLNPAAISVPQLPLTNDNSRNKINWSLAGASQKWRTAAKYRGFLILPVIITDQKQTNRKTERNKKVKAIAKSYVESSANGFWVVDSSLQDQLASPTFHRTRFPGIISFHEELNEKLENAEIRIAGPYWGLNLVIWARGLVDVIAIGPGRAFQYYLPGGTSFKPNLRLAIPPLRRCSQTGPEFLKWLDQAIGKTGETGKAFQEFSSLRKNYPQLKTQEVARRQIASFYKDWLDEIAKAHPSGRALALYQDLSSAYVLGKTLPTLPKPEKTARRPERVAEYFMMSCL